MKGWWKEEGGGFSDRLGNATPIHPFSKTSLKPSNFEIQIFKKTAVLWCLMHFCCSGDVDDERKKGGSFSDSLVGQCNPNPPLFTNFTQAFKFQNSTFQKVDRYVSQISTFSYWRISLNSMMGRGREGKSQPLILPPVCSVDNDGVARVA